MLSPLLRILSVAAISYGCIGRSNSKTNTARASGLEDCLAGAMGHSSVSNIRLRIYSVRIFLARPLLTRERRKGLRPLRPDGHNFRAPTPNCFGSVVLGDVPRPRIAPQLELARMLEIRDLVK